MWAAGFVALTSHSCFAKSGDLTSSNIVFLLLFVFLQMMKHAWDSYRQYGWGHNELKPLAKKGHSTNIFGKPDEPLSPTAVCAHWQSTHTVVNHTWMHAWMHTHSISPPFPLWTRLCDNASGRMHITLGWVFASRSTRSRKPQAEVSLKRQIK